MMIDKKAKKTETLLDMFKAQGKTEAEGLQMMRQIVAMRRGCDYFSDDYKPGKSGWTSPLDKVLLAAMKVPKAEALSLLNKAVHMSTLH